MVLMKCCKLYFGFTCCMRTQFNRDCCVFAAPFGSCGVVGFDACALSLQTSGARPELQAAILGLVITLQLNYQYVM